jgi:hypothetical protein
MPPRPCLYGINCARTDCVYTHPMGWNPFATNPTKPATIVCRAGLECTNKKCGFLHKEKKIPSPVKDNAWMKEKPCNRGDACTNKKCGFLHSEAWVKLNTIIPQPTVKQDCANGVNCLFLGHCHFNHPSQ